MSASSERAVVLRVDLHARPAGALVRAVGGFAGTVEILRDGKRADARSVLAVLGLGARAGESLVVRATGPEADAALAAAVTVLEAAE